MCFLILISFAVYFLVIFVAAVFNDFLNSLLEEVSISRNPTDFFINGFFLSSFITLPMFFVLLFSSSESTTSSKKFIAEAKERGYIVETFDKDFIWTSDIKLKQN